MYYNVMGGSVGLPYVAHGPQGGQAMCLVVLADVTLLTLATALGLGGKQWVVKRVRQGRRSW